MLSKLLNMKIMDIFSILQGSFSSNFTQLNAMLLNTKKIDATKAKYIYIYFM